MPTDREGPWWEDARLVPDSHHRGSSDGAQPQLRAAGGPERFQGFSLSQTNAFQDPNQEAKADVALMANPRSLLTLTPLSRMGSSAPAHSAPLRTAAETQIIRISKK